LTCDGSHDRFAALLAPSRPYTPHRFVTRSTLPLGQLLAATGPPREPNQSPLYVPPAMRRFDFDTRPRDQRGRFVAVAAPPSPPPPPPPPPPSIKALRQAAKRAKKAEYDEDPLYYAPHGAYEQDQYDAYVSYKEDKRKRARSPDW